MIISKNKRHSRSKFLIVEWILRPLIVCLLAFGIPLVHRPGSNKFNYSLIWIWGLVLLSINLWVALYSLWWLIKTGVSSTMDWSRGINTVNVSICTVAIHVGWLAASAPSCNTNLLAILQKLIDSFGQHWSDKKDFPICQRLRRISFIGSGCIVLVRGTLNSFS